MKTILNKNHKGNSGNLLNFHFSHWFPKASFIFTIQMTVGDWLIMWIMKNLLALYFYGMNNILYQQWQFRMLYLRIRRQTSVTPERNQSRISVGEAIMNSNIFKILVYFRDTPDDSRLYSVTELYSIHASWLNRPCRFSTTSSFQKRKKLNPKKAM